MLLSTAKAIIPQLDGICDKLGIDKCHRDGCFGSQHDEYDNYIPGGLIMVDVGEVHVGTAYRLNFDEKGKLVGIFKMYWHPTEGLQWELFREKAFR